MRVIHLSESKFNTILEEKEKELPFKTFYDETLKFITSLLKDPVGARPSEELTEYGLDNGSLRKKLCDFGVIAKKEDIREPYDETTGKKTSRYYVSYRVPRKNFKDKLRKLHKSLFNLEENNNV